MMNKQSDEQPRQRYAESFRAKALTVGIDSALIDGYYDAVYRVALAAKSRWRGAMITIGIGGGQGSGKSTLSRMLAVVLGDVFELTAETLSIDDFYLTHEDRQRLAARVHPLLAVRGVPGTHDMAWLRRTISELAGGRACSVPLFSKGDDDRLAQGRLVKPTDVLILEGWCWGARPAAPEDLIEPVNELEATRDVDGAWRQYVNDALGSSDYQACFSNDLSVFLAVPDMDAIFRWRLQAEQQLAGGDRVMDAAGIRNFIMYYQRISERMLADPTGDIVIRLGVDHGMQDVTISG